MPRNGRQCISGVRYGGAVLVLTLLLAASAAGFDGGALLFAIAGWIPPIPDLWIAVPLDVAAVVPLSAPR